MTSRPSLHIVSDPFSPPPGKKLYRLSEDEAYEFYSSYCPLVDSGYQPGEKPLTDQLLLARTNNAWAALGAKMGFDWTTHEQHPSGSVLLFYAAPLEPEKDPAP